MNTQQLESFVQVAENLNFARAAEVLNITQSAVSRQIHSLEEELGTRLFLRSTRAVALTPDGLSFLDDAKEILTRLQMASLKIGQHSQMNLQILTIGCINELYLDLLSELLARYRKQIPEVHPFLRIVPSRSILNFFFNGEMDLLLGFPDDIPEREGILYQEIAQVPICCVVPANHPFAGRKEIAEAELREQQIILCNSYETPSKAAALQHRLGHLFSPASINYCENTLAALTLTRAGYGIALLPWNLCPSPDVSYIPVAGMEPISYGVFYKGSTKSHAVKAFLAVAREYTQELH